MAVCIVVDRYLEEVDASSGVDGRKSSPSTFLVSRHPAVHAHRAELLRG